MNDKARAGYLLASWVMLFSLFGSQWCYAKDKEMVTVNVHDLYNVAFDACMYSALKEGLSALSDGNVEQLPTEEELQQQVTPCVMDKLFEMGIKSLPPQK